MDTPETRELPEATEARIEASPEKLPPSKRNIRRPRAMEVALLAISLAITVLLAALAGAVIGLSGSIGTLFSVGATRTSPPAGSYSIISVEGTIAAGNASGYQHTATVEYVRSLKENENDLGILLYMNTGGGGVYQSDELYRALMDYKETTGRPVWAYMANSCASGGVWVTAAADHIAANWNTTTGSIGVYYQFTDLSGLYGMLGIETVLVRTGENKGIGVDGTEFTEGHREVYQSMVDESYGRFLEIVAEGRGMSVQQLTPLADGRPYTASQALANGLIDEVGEWEATKEAFAELTGGTAYQTGFTTSSAISRLLNQLSEALPKSEAQSLISLAETQSNGLMALYEG